MENKSEYRHELYDGQLIGMAGASRPHRDIQTNLITGLTNRFRASKRLCKPFGSDTRVFVDATKYFYPDVVISCGKMQTDALNTARDPEVVIEILSDSTASFDKNEKAAAYRQISTLQQLVLIDSRAKAIVIYSKQGDNSWLEKSYDGSVTSVQIADENLPVNEIYTDVFA